MKYDEVYEVLNGINKLDITTYNKLIDAYGESYVNSIIDKMIEEDERNLIKFECYISSLVQKTDIPGTDLVKTYIKDIMNVPLLSAEDNRQLLIDINGVISKLERLFVEIDSDIAKSQLWITDKAEKCLGLSKDKKQLSLLSKLYTDFLNKRNLLVEGNLRLVMSAVKNFHYNDCNFNDMIQYGNIGLMRAIEKYNPKFGVAFSTYAYYWIRQSITRGMPHLLYSYDIPTNKVSENQTMLKAIELLRNQLGYDPTAEQVAQYLGFTVEKVRELDTLFAGTLSLDYSYGDATGDEEDNNSLMNLVEDPDADISEEVIANELKIEIIDVMNKVLTETEIYILRRRYGFDDGRIYTLEEVGKELGVTRERVRQLEAKAERKMRTKRLSMYLK